MAKKAPLTPALKRLTATLVYPPGEQKISEPIPPPNMTIAVLAGAVREAGHEAVQVDAEKEWFDHVARSFSAREMKLLYDKDAVINCVSGKARPATAAAFRRMGAKLLRGLGIKKTDLIGVTLVDIRAEPLIINFTALLCAAAKERFGAATVIGYRGMPRDAFLYLMKLYPCFDYGVYANWGERALLEILKELQGEKAKHDGTIARRGRSLKDYGGGNERRPRAPRADYDDAILDKYRAYDSEIFARYNSGFPFIKKLIKKDRRHLVVPYVFELTCPGACAFCENDNRLPSDAKSPDQVIDELSELKARGVTGVYFINSSFNNNYRRAEEICDKMIRARLGLKWFDCANLRVMDEHLLDKMRAAGAIKLTFGVETGSQRLLSYVNKGLTVERSRRYLSYAHKIGIWNHVELIGGFPTETPRDLSATLDFIDTIRDFVDVYTLNPFYLYPNSRFFREQKKFGLEVIPYPSMKKMNFFYPLYRIVEQYSMKFNEKGGLRWEEKNRQIMDSTAALAARIDEIATYRAMGNEHLYLLTCLYDKLGHDSKELIRKMVKVLTVRFKPYNLDFFMDDFRTSFSKEKDPRIFLPLKGTSFLGSPPEI